MNEEKEVLEYFEILSKIFYLDPISSKKTKKFYENFYHLIRYDVYITNDFYEKTLKLFQTYAISCDFKDPKNFYLSIVHLYNILKEKYRYDLLKMQIQHEYSYFEQNEFLSQNFEFLKKYFQSQIRREKYQDYTYKIPIEKSLYILRDYLKTFDSTYFLVSVYDNCIKKHLKLEDHTKDTYVYNDWYYDIERNRIYGSFTNTINDMYSLAHEFIHYYILNLYPYQECVLPETYITYKELPSIYHELNLSLYLEKRYKELICDIQAYEANRQNEFFWNISEDIIHNSFLKLKQGKPFDVSYISPRICDFMNKRILDITDGDSFDFYCYFLDYLVAKELREKVKNGDQSVNQKIMEIMNTLTYTNMHSLYFLDFLGNNALSFVLNQKGENVFPRCLEDKSLHF